MRTYKVEFTEDAIAGLADLQTWIEKDNPAARRVAARLIASCDGLEIMPN